MTNFKISQTSTHVDFLNVAEKAFSLLFTLFKAVRDFHCVTVPKRSIILIIKYLTSIHRKESLLSRGGGVLPYISYIGMFRPTGYGFCAVLAWKRVYTLPIFVWNWVWFSREPSGSVWTYLLFQFQMSKKEREICEFEMNLKNFFVCALI